MQPDGNFLVASNYRPKSQEFDFELLHPFDPFPESIWWPDLRLIERCEWYTKKWLLETEKHLNISMNQTDYSSPLEPSFQLPKDPQPCQTVHCSRNNRRIFVPVQDLSQRRDRWQFVVKYRTGWI